MASVNDKAAAAAATASAPIMVHEAFHAQAIKTPSAPCLVDAVTGKAWTYRETQHRVLSLASELRDAGTCADKVVAVYMDPCPRYVVSMLAALSAGGAYVPLELAYPTPMVERVLNDAKPTAVCTTLEHIRKLPAAAGEMAIVCEDDGSHDEKFTSDNESEWRELWTRYRRGWEGGDDAEGKEDDELPPPGVVATLDDLCFVVYSSGTTGQPKGIANPHRAPAVSYEWRFTTLSDYGPGDIVACNVFFVWEALRPLMRGGAVLPVPADDIYDGERLTSQIKRHGVTEILFTPSLLENMLLTVDPSDVLERLSTVKTIYLNGEVVSLALRRKVIETLSSVRLLNLYSISECHEVAALDLTSAELDLSHSDKFCPVGYPSTACYIVDEECQPLPFGEAGELFVGGDMLARGYLNLPDLTATRFVPDPFLGKEKEGSAEGGGEQERPRPMMYRTGDRARFLPNGQLEILGRCDFMVKIRGYSVVLGAVETALVEHVKLSSCVVVADGEEGSEDKQLIAYLVRDHSEKDGDTRLADWTIDNRNGACPEIRRAIDGRVAHYMVPSVYIEVESLPVAAVGAKLDRKALQAQTKDRRAMMRSLQLNFETHTTATNAALVPATTASSTASLRKLSKYLRVPRDAPLPDVECAMIALWECVLVMDDTVSIGLESNFQEEGGHSLSAARLVSSINKCFSVRLSAAKLFRDNFTVQNSCMEVLKQWSEAAAVAAAAAEEESLSSESKGTSRDWSVVGNDEQNAEIIARVRNDAVLPPELSFQACSTAITAASARSVFLTGATGYLGVHILAQILSMNDMATVTCLVRSSDPDVVRKNCDKYGLKVDHSRVVLERGDLSLKNLGMSQADWNRVSASVDFIIHCGAMVSLTAPYDKMQDINVGGTLETIKLASACREGTSLVYVSSNGIFPSTTDEVFMENEGISCLPDRLGSNNGYGLSKWAAEQLVTEAGRRGLSTLSIRFGNIGWDSVTAAGNALDFQAMILNGCLRIGKALDLPNWNFECTPVDFASKSLLSLASDEATLKSNFVLNCTQDGFTPFKDVFQLLNSVSSHELPSVKFESWCKVLEDAAMETNDDSVTALFSFISGLEDCQSYLMDVPKLDCSIFDATLVKIGSPLKRSGLVSKSYYETYFRSILPIDEEAEEVKDSDAVPFDPSGNEPATGPLAGQVAVVTGASSGIGRAIVSALVKAGAHVAMGARRVEELEKTRQIVMEECPGTTSMAVIVKTDVTKLSDVQNLVEKAEKSLGAVDILVNNAGVMHFTLMQNVKWDQWEQTVDVNCKGAMYGIGAILPSMLKRGKGHIVNITSDAGRKAFPGLGIYSGTKFFLEAVSQCLRAETASTGLRVTCIQPGNVETPLLSFSTDQDALKAYGEPSGAKVLEPADVGRAVVYAVSQPEWCAVNEILIEPREEPA